MLLQSKSDSLNTLGWSYRNDPLPVFPDVTEELALFTAVEKDKTDDMWSYIDKKAIMPAARRFAVKKTESQRVMRRRGSIPRPTLKRSPAAVRWGILRTAVRKTKRHRSKTRSRANRQMMAFIK